MMASACVSPSLNWKMAYATLIFTQALKWLAKKAKKRGGKFSVEQRLYELLEQGRAELAASM